MTIDTVPTSIRPNVFDAGLIRESGGPVTRNVPSRSGTRGVEWLRCGVAFGDVRTTSNCGAHVLVWRHRFVMTSQHDRLTHPGRSKEGKHQRAGGLGGPKSIVRRKVLQKV